MSMKTLAVLLTLGIPFAAFAAAQDTPDKPLPNDPTAGSWLAPATGARFIAALRAGKKVTIVTMGTSLTGLWPGVMVNDWLNLEWPGQVTLCNEGMGASASSHLGFSGISGNPQANSGLGKLDAVIAHKPDVVFIEFGVNDAYLPYNISLEESKKNLNTMIDKILAANPATEIILQTMNSVTDHATFGLHATVRPQVAAYYQGYRDVAKARGLLVVDHYRNWLKIMTDDLPLFDRLVPDRIHPQVPGLQQVLLPELKAVLNPPRAAAAPPGALDALLDPVAGKLRLLVCKYDGVKLAATRPFVAGEVQTPASRWTSSVQATPVANEEGALDVAISVKLADGVAKAAGVAVAFDFANWSANNYVLVPAAVYNGNRFRVVNTGYGAHFPKTDYFNKNATLIFSDSPRLSCTPGVAAKIEMLTGNASTPAMCFFSPAQRRGVILLAEQKTRFGNSGLFIEENAAQDAATFVVSAPGVRERAAGFGDYHASGDAGADWKPGDELSLRLRLYSFAAEDIPALLEKFMSVRKGLTGPNHPRNLTPFSAVLKFSLDLQNATRWYDSPSGSFFRSANCDNLDFGWAGGLIGTFPQLALDEALPRERVFKNIDTVLATLQGKSGYFYTCALNGKVVDERVEVPGMALTRRNADGLFWLVKHFQLLKAQGHGDLIKPAWEQATKRLAQAFVRTWKKEGEFGNYLHPETGEVVIFNSTSGAAAPGGLALAGQYFNEPEFIQVAKDAARFYFTRDVVKLGLTGGGCADILQDADCESAYGFLGSLLALYEVSGDQEWLAMARTVANLCATWTVSYDHEFPPGSTLHNLKANMAGAVWASVQNKHAAPGICTTSADYLFKLYRATGQRAYAELLRDIIHAHAEVMETPGRPTTGMGPGSSMERITLADGEGKGAIGQILHTSNGWTEDNGMLMAMENPGIYVRTDKDEVYVFDHVEVKSVKRDNTGVTLEITNPTRFDAKVAILAESAEQAAKPLGTTAFPKWPKFEVKAGATIQVTLN
jgi:lysophospholipase L1-like esterase